MIIKLHEQGFYDGCEKVTLEHFKRADSPELSKRKMPAVIIMPGGGYSMVSAREGEPVADVYKSAGFSVFILTYSVAPHASEKRPLLDSAAAIKYVRENAESFNVDPDRIVVCGFSAGGHLAAMSATCWNDEYILKKLGTTKEAIRPNGAILCYPVISAEASPHVSSFLNLTGGDSSPHALDAFSLEKKVTADTPPCFIWHTMHDTCVGVNNSIVFAKALVENNVLCELHMFCEGDHGLSLATLLTSPDKREDAYDLPHVARWAGWSIEWIKKYI